MEAPTFRRPELVERLEQLAVDVAAPGLSTTIRGYDLRELLNELYEQKAARALLAETAGALLAEHWLNPEDEPWESEGAATATLPSGLAEAVPAFADILASHSELWGHGLVDSLLAWCAQQGIDGGDMIASVEKALAGGN
jgi:hypothetical protein